MRYDDDKKDYTFLYKKPLYKELVQEIMRKYNHTDFLPKLKTEFPFEPSLVKGLESLFTQNLARFPLVT